MEEYDRIEPIGRSFDRWQMAMLIACFYNAHRDRDKSNEASAEDYLPHVRKEAPVSSIDDQIAAVRAVTEPLRRRAAEEKKKKAAKAKKAADRKAAMEAAATPKGSS